MANIKMRLEIATQKGREHLNTIETVAIPRVGERLRTSSKQTFEVIEVVHTPWLSESDVLIILKTVSVATVAMTFLAA